MKGVFIACVLASLLSFMTLGCTKLDESPAADKDTPAQAEEHKVMKPVVPDEGTTTNESSETDSEE